jgi:hypothetical protein
MCIDSRFWSSRCGHHWITIQQPCRPGRNFYNCPIYHGATIMTKRFPPHRHVRNYKYCCPWCDLDGDYDDSMTRVIIGERRAFKIGIGPRQVDPGIEFSCAVM